MSGDSTGAGNRPDNEWQECWSQMKTERDHWKKMAESAERNYLAARQEVDARVNDIRELEEDLEAAELRVEMVERLAEHRRTVILEQGREHGWKRQIPDQATPELRHEFGMIQLNATEERACHAERQLHLMTSDWAYEKARAKALENELRGIRAANGKQESQ